MKMFVQSVIYVLRRSYITFAIYFIHNNINPTFSVKIVCYIHIKCFLVNNTNLIQINGTSKYLTGFFLQPVPVAQHQIPDPPFLIHLRIPNRCRSVLFITIVHNSHNQNRDMLHIDRQVYYNNLYRPQDLQ